MTLAELIASLEAKRAANVARMKALSDAAAGRTMDEAEADEFDGLEAENTSIDKDLTRRRKLLETTAAGAVPVPAAAGTDPAVAAAARAAAAAQQHQNSGIIAVRPNVEKGVKMARWCMALHRAGGSIQEMESIIRNNKGWMDTTPELLIVAKAAVAAGDTTTAGWASELVYNQNLVSEFVDFLRPMTVLGKLSLRRVPFNIRFGTQTGGGTGYWTGQGAPVPVSKLATGSGSLGIAKANALTVIDQELARSSSPSAEMLVRDSLAKDVATFSDVQFLDPNVAAVANVNPAAITNGITPIVATGVAAANLRTDVASMLANIGDNDLDPSTGVFIMTPTQAMNIGLILNSLGLPLYPNINMKGGEFLGFPVVVSNSANIPGSPGSGRMIIFLIQDEVFLADDGQVTIEVSTEAAIQMLDNPTNASTGGTVATTMVSMFQTNSMAIKATRFINYQRRRTQAVQFIKEAAYAA